MNIIEPGINYPGYYYGGGGGGYYYDDGYAVMFDGGNYGMAAGAGAYNYAFDSARVPESNFQSYYYENTAEESTSTTKTTQQKQRETFREVVKFTSVKRFSALITWSKCRCCSCLSNLFHVLNI